MSVLEKLIYIVNRVILARNDFVIVVRLPSRLMISLAHFCGATGLNLPSVVITAHTKPQYSVIFASSALYRSMKTHRKKKHC